MVSEDISTILPPPCRRIAGDDRFAACPHSSHVHGHHPIPLSVPNLVERSECRQHARIVHGDINPAVDLQRPGCHRLDASILGHIDYYSDGLAAASPYLVDNVSTPQHVRRDDSCAFATEGATKLATDPSSCARHDGHPILQPHLSPPAVCRCNALAARQASTSSAEPLTQRTIGPGRETVVWKDCSWLTHDADDICGPAFLAVARAIVTTVSGGGR